MRRIFARWGYTALGLFLLASAGALFAIVYLQRTDSEATSMKPLSTNAAITLQQNIPADWIIHLDWSPDGRHLLAVTRSSTGAPDRLVLYDPTSWKMVETFPFAVDGETVSTSWARDGQRLAVTWANRGLLALAVGQKAPTSERPVDGLLMHVAWKPGDDTIAGVAFTRQGRPHVLVWSGVESEPSQAISLRDQPGGTFPWMGWSPSGRYLGVLFSKQQNPSFTSFENRLFVFESSGESNLVLVHTVNLPDGAMSPMHSSEGWSPDESTLAVPMEIGQGAAMALVKPALELVEAVWRPEEANAPLRGAAWAPSGTCVATTDQFQVSCLSSDGKSVRFRLASRYPDSDPRWSMSRKGGEMAPDVSLSGYTNALAWSPDGTRLALGNTGALRICLVSLGTD